MAGEGQGQSMQNGCCTLSAAIKVYFLREIGRREEMVSLHANWECLPSAIIGMVELRAQHPVLLLWQ